jgi:hypothetical protein
VNVVPSAAPARHQLTATPPKDYRFTADPGGIPVVTGVGIQCTSPATEPFGPLRRAKGNGTVHRLAAAA